MYTLAFGLYPIAAIAVCALLTLNYFCVVRLKCSARWAIGFIFATMAVTTVCSLVSPVQLVEVETAVELLVEPEKTSVIPVTMTDTAGELTPQLKIKMQQPIAANIPSVASFLHNASHLLRWLWLTGICALLLYLLWQLFLLYRLRQRQEYVSDIAHARLYATDGTDAYSFGRNIFIPREFDDEMRRFTTLHELSHVKHRHFLWLCVFQLLLAINWYNPFCWLLLREIRLQQELQVDGDVLRQGVDRTAYQYSLLQTLMHGGSSMWILSAFGRKSITNRVAFMNSDINARSNMRRAVVSALLTLIVLALTMAVACQSNKQPKKHALYGWWKMDFTKDTNSSTEMYSFGKQICFYSYDTFLTITYRKRNGNSLNLFTFSMEETRLKNDTLVDALGNPINYEFIDDDTFQSHWHKQPYQNAMPQGPDITDQWSRIPIDEGLMGVFRQLYHSDKAHNSKFDGVWLGEGKEAYKEYMVLNDTIAMVLFYHRQEPKAYRAAGYGYSTAFRELGDHLQFGDQSPVKYSMTDADHMVFKTFSKNGTTDKVYHRIKMPSDLKRMLSTPLTNEH